LLQNLGEFFSIDVFYSCHIHAFSMVIADLISAQVIAWVLAFATIAGLFAGIGGWLHAHRMAERAERLQGERDAAMSRTQAAILEVLSGLTESKPKQGTGEEVAQRNQAKPASRAQQFRLTDAVASGEDSQAIGEVSSPFDDGRLLTLVQLQRSHSTELLIMRWSGFDLVLAQALQNHSGASFLLRTDEGKLEFTTLDQEADGGLNEVMVSWDGNEVRRRSMGPPENGFSRYFETPPPWAARWSGTVDPI
jgi:hypothetical protein